MLNYRCIRLLINLNNYMFRPIAAIFRLLQIYSKSITYSYMPILRGDAGISSSLRVTVYLVGCLMVNDWWDVSFMGSY